MRLSSNNHSNSHLFIMDAIQRKRNSKMYLGTHETDYDESDLKGGIYHTDIVHEDKHEDTWAGYVDINKVYENNYPKEGSHW